MAYFPGTQAFRQPYPRNRTKQGGNNRRATNAYGLPNLLARGFPVPGRGDGNRLGRTGGTGDQMYIAGQPRGWTQGNAWWKQAGMTPQTKGQRKDLTDQPDLRRSWLSILPGDSPKGPGGYEPPPQGDRKRPGPGGEPNTDIRYANPTGLLEAFLAGDRKRNPLEHQQLWASRGFLYNPNREEFVRRPNAMDIFRNRDQLTGDYQGGGGAGSGGPGGGGGGNGGGGGGGNGGGGGGGNNGGNPFAGIDWDNLPEDMNWGQIVRQLGLPLDPYFTQQETGLRGIKDLALMNASNLYNTGTADMELQNVLANRNIDEQTAARGIFGSGIENRYERLQNNDFSRGMLGLLDQYKSTQLGANMDYRTGLMQAIMELAQRSLADPYSPIPNWDTTRNGGRNGGRGGGGRG